MGPSLGRHDVVGGPVSIVLGRGLANPDCIFVDVVNAADDALRCRELSRSFTRIALQAKTIPMPPPLSVYHEDRKRIGRNNSSHISLGNSSRPVRTMTLLIVFSVLLVAGCASERSSKKPPSDRTFFDSPDVESLH